MLPIFVLQLNLGIYLKDNTTDLFVLVDREVGRSSISDGELELMLHRYMTCAWEKKASGWHIYKGLKLLNFSCCCKRVGFYKKWTVCRACVWNHTTVEDEREKTVVYSLMLFIFSQMLAAWWWMGCGRGAQWDSVQQQWQMWRPDCMCSQYTHIHSQQHRFYAFLSTFLLKSLPSSSLWCKEYFTSILVLQNNLHNGTMCMGRKS
jgi:hypothetical protein